MTGLALGPFSAVPAAQARQADGSPAAVRVAGTGESLKQCSSDESLSFKSCVTMNYSIGQMHGHTVVNLKNYQYKINRIDTSQLNQVTKLQAKMGFFSLCYSLCGGLESKLDHGVLTKVLTPPSVGKVYTYVPSWAGRWWVVADAMYYLCGNAKITVKRRESTWTDQLPNVCQGVPQMP